MLLFVIKVDLLGTLFCFILLTILVTMKKIDGHWSLSIILQYNALNNSALYMVRRFIALTSLQSFSNVNWILLWILETDSVIYQEVNSSKYSEMFSKNLVMKELEFTNGVIH